MLDQSLILNRPEAYTLTKQYSNKSIRSVAEQPLTAPNLLTVSHEVTKSGRVSTALIFEDIETLTTATGIIADSVKVFVKLQYSPFAGRADVKLAIKAQILELVALLNNTAIVDKVLNQET